jgi:hypothetical protein
MIYFSDVDVVVKLASCGFLPLLPELLGVDAKEIKIRYLVSLRSRLTRKNKKLADANHQKHLEAFCQAHATVSGVGSLARVEQLIFGGMDSGEAILFAEAETTGGIIVTGDKRALVLYGKLSTPAQRAKIKVVCWEQLLLRVREMRGYEVLRQGCCGGIDCDKFLLLAFSSGLATQEDHAVAALESYLNGVKKHSSDILYQFDSQS